MVKEDLEIAFAALSSDTRKRIQEEMEHAIYDTSVEYHRSEGEVAQDLWKEIQAIRQVLNEVLAAQEQFDGIFRTDSSVSDQIAEPNCGH